MKEIYVSNTATPPSSGGILANRKKTLILRNGGKIELSYNGRLKWIVVSRPVGTELPDYIDEINIEIGYHYGGQLLVKVIDELFIDETDHIITL